VDVFKDCHGWPAAVTQLLQKTSIQRGALIATGLVLFVITLIINMAARAIVTRGESKRVRV